MPRNADHAATVAAFPERLSEGRSHWRYQPAPDCLAGRVILVTGAGDGIGRAAACTFASYGAHVILLGRTRSKLEHVFDWIAASTDTRPVIVPCDLAALNDDSAGALVDAIGGEFGRLDGLLHNASMLGPRLPIAHFPSDQWLQVMQINVNATFVLTRSLLDLLGVGGDASVVFTSSSVGRQGRAYWGAYAVSKFAVEGLCQVLADEHETADRIRFNSLNPGGTRTAMRAAAYPAENPAELPSAERRMDIYLYLFEAASRRLNGAALDARSWEGPAPATS